MPRAVHSVSDWTDDHVDAILKRAGELADGAEPRVVGNSLVGMCFFQPSLRTRVGFEVAAHKLGARFVEAHERRSSPESMPERIEDTIRVMSGYCDTLIVRSPKPSADLLAAALPGTSWLNAGDSSEHPTQSLIDVFAMERLVGPVGDLRVAIAGDMRMRSVRSLMSLFGRRPPAELLVATVPALTDGCTPTSMQHVADVAEIAAFKPDVVYLAGVPHQAVPEEVRTRLRFSRETFASLNRQTVVLSPLPLIDEVASNARDDPRIKWFEQSDLGVSVRAALLEHVVDDE